MSTEPNGPRVSIQDVLDRIDLNNIVARGDGYRTRCPAHDGETMDSLSIKPGDDGRALVFCHGAGCSYQDIMTALGLWNDAPYQPSSNGGSRRKKQSKKQEDKQEKTYTTKQEKTHTTKQVYSRPVYEFRNLAGEVVYVQRHKGAYYRPVGEDRWIAKLEGVEMLPYNLPELVEGVRQKKTVYHVEGCKDADTAIERLGVTATTTGGVKTWRSEYRVFYQGADVVILPDNDPEGEEYARKVAAHLAGVARSVKIVQLPGLPHKGDLTDFMEAGGTPEQVSEAVEAAPYYRAEGNSANSANSANGVSDEEEPEPWARPAAFYSVSLPEFPRGVFPEWVEAQVEGTAAATQTPRDLSGMLALGVGAAAIAKVVEVAIWEGWREQTNLYTATGMRSGSRKTTVFQRMTAPIEEHEAQLVEDTAEEIAEQRTRYKIYEERLRKAQTRAAKAEGDELDTLTADAMTAASDLESIRVPATPRLLVDDASPERVASMLAEQGGRLALMSPEGGVFDMMAGRYSQGIPNLDVYLKGHAGDALRVDRVGRPADHVRKPALTIALAVQPDVLQGLAGRPGFRGRGLIGRHLYSIPKDTLGRRVIRPKAVPERVGRKYAEKLRALLDLADDLPVEEREAEVLRFGIEAQDEMEAFLSWIEPMLAEDGDLGDMTDWAGKLAGAVARTAGILHMFEHAGETEPWKKRLAGETMRRAVKIGHYLIPHAKYALAVMGSDPTVEDAKYVLRWIERKGGERFTKRDAFEGTKGRFGKVSEMEPALDLLVSHGYLREHHPEERRGAGRKPSPTYEVNPVWLAESNEIKHERHSHYSHYSQNRAALEAGVLDAAAPEDEEVEGRL